MGGKSCLAVTLPLGELPSPGLVNPCLTARDHIFSRNLGSAFGVESGLSTQATGNCGIPATLDADLAASRRKRLAPPRRFGYWEFTDVDGPAARPGGGSVNAL